MGRRHEEGFFEPFPGPSAHPAARGTATELILRLAGTPSRDSQVRIGGDLLEDLPASLSSRFGDSRIFWIWDETVHSLWHERTRQMGWSVPSDDEWILFPASEPNKRLSELEKLARRLVRSGADRCSVLVAVGGGVTGDLVGFLASIYMRGIPHCQVPTTLLAQVDSSIGGKTGVDLPEGKNLLGTFHQARFIHMDIRFLETLPEEEMRQGMAEAIKTAMIGDPSLWGFLETESEAIRSRRSEALLRVVSSCCRLKTLVVEADERESGYRMVLNLGHTIGHALEKITGYTFRHGDAVAVGMAAAARISLHRGTFSATDLHRLERLCRFWNLPTALPRQASPDELLAALSADKKRLKGVNRFVLPRAIGEVDIRSDVALEEVRKALATMSSP